MSTESHIRAELEECAKCPNPCFVDIIDVPNNIREKVNYEDVMYGTVSEHKSHILITTGMSFTKWPAKLEGETESLFGKANAYLKDNIAGYRLTALARGPANGGSPEEECDLFIFPHRIAYYGVTEDKLADVLKKHFAAIDANETPVDGTPITKEWVLICGHKLRDNRCGVIAPQLRDQFYDVQKERKLYKEVEVDIVSHIGGHKYAGNVIIMTNKPIGMVWYGRVFTEHVDNIVYSTLINGEILKPLLRGNIANW